MWQQMLTDRFTEYLRFFIRAHVLVNAIWFGLASIYFTMKVCWFGLDYFDHTIFSAPWR